MKNYVKKIVASLLAVVFCLGSVQATQAAPEPRATEVWYVGHNYDYDYTMEDTNTTKPKLLGNSGKLVVYGNFYKDDSGASNIKLTAKLLEYPSGRVLDETEVSNTNFPSSNNFILSAYVQHGTQVQLFFDASSINNPPGFFRKAHLHYTAYID